MDTGTHVVMGIALGGLATLDPVVASDPLTHQAIIIGVLVGSQAPDFDTVTKLRNNAVYLRNHRGMTHSIPAVCLWPILIAGALFAVFPDVDLFHLWLWTFFSVILHVFVDVFNAYGTQAFRPFSKKWIGLGVINTFDPFIFFSHLIALLIWRYTGEGGYTILTLYIILIFYYIWRFKARNRVQARVLKEIPAATQMFISPSYRWSDWHIAVKDPNFFYVIKIKKNKLKIVDTFEQQPLPTNDIIEAAATDENITAFLSFSKIYTWEIHKEQNKIEVRFTDLRYLSKSYYPFVAVVHLNLDLMPQSSFTGWVFSEDKLQKKLSYIIE